MVCGEPPQHNQHAESQAHAHALGKSKVTCGTIRSLPHPPTPTQEGEGTKSCAQTDLFHEQVGGHGTRASRAPRRERSCPTRRVPCTQLAHRVPCTLPVSDATYSCIGPRVLHATCAPRALHAACKRYDVPLQRTACPARGRKTNSACPARDFERIGRRRRHVLGTCN